MRIHPGAAATIALLLQRGAKEDEIDGIIAHMAQMPDSAGKLYRTQIEDFDQAIQTYRRRNSPLVASPKEYLV